MNCRLFRPNPFALGLAILAVCGVWGQRAEAHPLGNYSINQYTLFDLRGDVPKVRYMLDVAEIPSFREMDLLDKNIDDQIEDDEIDAYLAKRVPDVLKNLQLTVNGEPVELGLTAQRLEVYEGVGSMPVFNLFLDLQPTSWTWPAGDKFVIEFRSFNHEEARGYREAYVLTDKRFDVFTGPWDDRELKYLTLVLQDDQGNPLFQSFYNRFRLEMSLGSGLVQADHPEAATFAWTATARKETQQPTILANKGQTFTTAVVAKASPSEAAPAQPESKDGTAASASAAASAETGATQVPATAKVAEDTGAKTHVTIAKARASQPANEGVSEFAQGMIDKIDGVLRTKDITVAMLVFALAVSAFLGMAHAFSPGHGKTVMAAYLIGERGTVWHAIALGIIVTITHVWSILALGVVSLYLTDYFSEEQFTFWTGVLSGGLVFVIGLVLLKQRYTRYVLERHGVGAAASHHHHRHHHDHDEEHAHTHDHGHDHSHVHEHDHEHSHEHAHEHSHSHDHGHDHSHTHEHDHDHHHHGMFSHTHVVEGKDGKPPTYRNILWLGISGGIVPCPAALIVLMAAISIGRLALGLLLIVSFSIGLAAVLVGVGIAVVRASGEVRKRMGEQGALLLLLPVISSILITVLGLLLLFNTLRVHNVIMVPGLG